MPGATTAHGAAASGPAWAVTVELPADLDGWWIDNVQLIYSDTRYGELVSVIEDDGLLVGATLSAATPPDLDPSTGNPDWIYVARLPLQSTAVLQPATGTSAPVYARNYGQTDAGSLGPVTSGLSLYLGWAALYPDGDHVMPFVGIDYTLVGFTP
jgi:hypothetical protein